MIDKCTYLTQLGCLVQHDHVMALSPECDGGGETA